MKTLELSLSHLHRSEWTRQLNAMSDKYPVRDTLLNMRKRDARIAMQVKDKKLLAFLVLIPGVLPGDAVGILFGNAPGATESFAEEAMRLFNYKVLRMQIPQKHFHPEAERLGIIKNFSIMVRRGAKEEEEFDDIDMISGERFATTPASQIVDIRELLEYAVGVEETYDQLKREHLRYYDSQRVIGRMNEFGFFAFVCRRDEKVVGILTCQANAVSVEVNGLAVAETHQGQGIATRLVKTMIRTLQEYYDQYDCAIFTRNVKSIALFSKLGFVEEDALFMKLAEDTLNEVCTAAAN